MLYGGLFETVLFLFELFQTISYLFFWAAGSEGVWVRCMNLLVELEGGRKSGKRGRGRWIRQGERGWVEDKMGSDYQKFAQGSGGMGEIGRAGGVGQKMNSCCPSNQNASHP